MLKKNKIDEFGLPPLSIWEKEWTRGDYLAQEKEFIAMRSEYRTMVQTSQGDPVLGRWRLFEKWNAARIEYDEGVDVINRRKYHPLITDLNAYRIANAKIEKYFMWESFLYEKNTTLDERREKLREMFSRFRKPAVTISEKTQVETPEVEEKKVETPTVQQEEEIVDVNF